MCFPACCRSHIPLSCLPSLHRHYPVSSLLRRLCHLPGRFFGPLGHERRSFPRIVIPDSRHSNFLPFYLLPPHAFLRLRSLSHRNAVRRSRLALRGSASGSRLHLYQQARQCIRPNRVQHGFVYGLAIRFRLLSTPSLDDAVTFSFGQPVFCPEGTFTSLLVCAFRRTGPRRLAEDIRSGWDYNPRHEHTTFSSSWLPWVPWLPGLYWFPAWLLRLPRLFR